MKRATIQCRILLWLGIILPSFCHSILPAQTNSVVTVNSDNVLVIKGRKVFTIGFSPAPPINGKTPMGDDALQRFYQLKSQ